MNAARAARALLEEAWTHHDRWGRCYGRARDLLQEALRSNPDEPLLLICYGTVLSDMGSHRKAAEVLRKALALGSDDRHAFFNLGVALINCGDHDDGRAFLHQASDHEAHPDTWEAYFDPQGH